MRLVRSLLLLVLPTAAAAERVRAPEPAPPPPPGNVAALRPRSAPPAPPVPAPHASAEVAKHGQRVAGAYTCRGSLHQPDGSSAPVVAKVTIKTDLDGAWIVTQWTDPTAKRIDYRTFDDASRQWTRFSLASDGSHETLTSLGERAGEWQWEGTQLSSTGSVQVKHHEKVVGTQLDIWGEALLGGTWTKVYTASCKR